MGLILQRERARAGSTFDQHRGEAFALTSDAREEMLRKAGDAFEGYTSTRVPKVRILAVFDDDRKEVERLAPGEPGYVALDRTPFYVEAGGQVSDMDELRAPAGTTVARVEGVVRMLPGLPVRIASAARPSRSSPGCSSRPS